jgi:hypothetical protein
MDLGVPVPVLICIILSVTLLQPQWKCLIRVSRYTSLGSELYHLFHTYDTSDDCFICVSRYIRPWFWLVISSCLWPLYDTNDVCFICVFMYIGTSFLNYNIIMSEPLSTTQVMTVSHVSPCKYLVLNCNIIVSVTPLPHKWCLFHMCLNKHLVSEL